MFLALIALIFCVEAGEMLVLDHWLSGKTSMWEEVLADAFVITLIVAAFVWQFFVRPLRSALVSETARATAITEAAADAIISIDEHGIVKSFNRAAERLFGYAAAEVIGSDVKVLMPEQYARVHDLYLRNGKVRLAGEPRQAVALRKDGTQCPIELNVTGFRLGGARQFTAMVRDISERLRHQEEIHRLAYYDHLTGVPNRTLFYDRLDQALTAARRARHELAVLYCDLDGFKGVNDALGHDAGDHLLKEVAARIRHVMRESDTVARLGGDEFTVILRDARSREDAAIVAEKLRQAIAQPLRTRGGTQELYPAVAIGIAMFPDDGDDAPSLVHAADRAMYQAKELRRQNR